MIEKSWLKKKTPHQQNFSFQKYGNPNGVGGGGGDYTLQTSQWMNWAADR